ncbi:hypothetical protein [Algirhabdus cladophorae]|uniref:hypothetical protein n=1 Tax=Algirhabdus cladophorae TaxID=3377108 RepID=UPI003B846E6C
MFHKKGNIFHRTRQGTISQAEYREAISAALVHDLGGAGRAAKTITKWTGVNDRTAKNWILGYYGPSGEHLIELMRHSDTVLAVVLKLAGRDNALAEEQVKHFRHELRVVLDSLDAIYGTQDE